MEISIGRIVHFVSRGSADGVYPPRHVPLLVVDAEYGSVSGWAFNPNGLRYEQNVEQDEGDMAGGTWHWPERV
jgi:hypothetical protein